MDSLRNRIEKRNQQIQHLVCDNQAFVDEKVAAAILGLSVQSLRNARCTTGRLAIPYYKVGRSVRYRVGDLFDSMEQPRIDPQASV